MELGSNTTTIIARQQFQPTTFDGFPFHSNNGKEQKIAHSCPVQVKSIFYFLNT